MSNPITYSASGADNQQESSQEEKWLSKIPQNLGYYLAGFVDGEGSFNVSLRQKSDYAIKWQVVLSFNVSQRDMTNLLTLKEVLGCGIIKKRKDGVYSLDITTPQRVILRVIPFFRKFPFRSEKAIKNFAIFCKIAALMSLGNHRHKKGLKEIVSIRETLNVGAGRKRKYNEADVLKSLLEKSSETIRQAPIKSEMI
ncbi:LAGLIDADG family homing endonuclease [Candidatus Microgenomates bacterium]|nr:LAGLIDADG family homing endonuclease [Candidatus Microgenomates bacterium]